MAAEQFSGRISSVNDLGTNDKGWRNYDLVFENGSSFPKVGVAPDNHVVIAPGVSVTLFKSKYSWMVGKDQAPAQQYQQAPQYQQPPAPQYQPQAPMQGSQQAAQTPPPPAPTYQARNWEDFNSYQINSRDPKIERQTYIRMMVDLYIASLPYLAQPPRTTLDIDRYFDDAKSKGDAVYQSVNVK